MFDPEGRWLGRVSLPLVRIYDIGEDWVLGLARDRHLVESVREHRLIRR